MTWINNGYIHKFIPIDEVDQFLLENKDWEIGRIRKINEVIDKFYKVN